MQLRDVAALPPTLHTREAAELLGCSADHLWALAREGDAPVAPLRLGRTLRWPTAPLLDLLGLTPQREGAPAATGAPRETPSSAHQSHEKDPHHASSAPHDAP